MSDTPPPPPDDRPPPPPPPDLMPPTAPVAAPDEPIRRVRGLATWILVTTGVAVITSIVTTMLTPGAADDARDFLNGVISEDQFVDRYGPISTTQLVQSLATAATAALTMLWMFRMSKNVRAMGRETTWAPLFAVFGWVLPPVLVVIPFLMLRELWKASTPGSLAGGDEWRRADDNPVFWIWFLLYGVLQAVLLVVQASTFVGAGFADDAEGLAETIDDAGTISLISGLGVFLAGIAWMILVRRLTDRHVELTGEG